MISGKSGGLGYLTGYDSYHKNKDRIYRVVTSVLNRGNGEVISQHAYAPLGLGDVIRKEVAGVGQVSAFFRYSPWQAHIGAKGSPDGKVFLQNNICSAEPALFSMIDVRWLDGNAGGLKDPQAIVLAGKRCQQVVWRLAPGGWQDRRDGFRPCAPGRYRRLPRSACQYGAAAGDGDVL